MTKFSTGYRKKIVKQARQEVWLEHSFYYWLIETDWCWTGTFLACVRQALRANSRADFTFLLPFAQSLVRASGDGLQHWVEQEIQLHCLLYSYIQKFGKLIRAIHWSSPKPLKPCLCQGSCLTRIPQKVLSLSIHIRLRKAFWGEEISPIQLTSSSMGQRKGKVPSLENRVSFSYTLPIYLARIQDVHVLIISSPFTPY